MTEVTKANITPYSAGDLKGVAIDLTDVQNGYTITVPHLSKITKWGFGCTTDDSIGGTIASNVITVACGATLAGKFFAEGK